MRFRGFTILEVMVAVLVLGVGLLGLGASLALATRMIAQGSRYRDASLMAVRWLEVLRSQECPAIASGSATEGPYRAVWNVVELGGGRGKVVTLVVTSPTGRGVRADTLATAIPC